MKINQTFCWTYIPTKQIITVTPSAIHVKTIKSTRSNKAATHSHSNRNNLFSSFNLIYSLIWTNWRWMRFNWITILSSRTERQWFVSGDLSTDDKSRIRDEFKFVTSTVSSSPVWSLATVSTVEVNGIRCSGSYCKLKWFNKIKIKWKHIFIAKFVSIQMLANEIATEFTIWDCTVQ